MKTSRRFEITDIKRYSSSIRVKISWILISFKWTMLSNTLELIPVRILRRLISVFKNLIWSGLYLDDSDCSEP